MMGGLALKLAPRERVMINGVIVENGPRRAQLLIKTENAAVLRMRDALEASDVIGPASEAYFAAQRGVSGEISVAETSDQLRTLMATLLAIDSCEEMVRSLDQAMQALESGNLYRVMRALRPLIEAERDIAKSA